MLDMGPCLYDPALGRFLEADPVAGGSANDYDYCAGDPVNCFDLAGTMKTPENKSSANEFFAYLAARPEVVAFLTALSATPAKPAAPKPGPQTSSGGGGRGPDPRLTDGGRRGPDPCPCPVPTGPRRDAPRISARDGVAVGGSILVGAGVSVGCEAATLGIGTFGCGVVGGAAGAGTDWLIRRLW